MDKIREFYADMKGHHPDLQGPIRLRAEADNVWPPGSASAPKSEPAEELAPQDESLTENGIDAPTKAAS